jgi:hypothetical protein
MNTVSTILSWALAAAPSSPPEPFTVVQVDMDRSDESTQLTAYGPDGEVAGEVFVWVDVNGQIRLDAMFADGLYMAVSTDGTEVMIDAADTAVVAARMNEITVALEQTSGEWGTCAWEAGVAVIECAAVRPILCIGGTIVAACTCLPLLVDEWEGYSCPGPL